MIAIMAVLVGTLMFSIVMIFSANAKACANAMQSAIADCKVTTMGKSDAYLEIYRDTDGNVYGRMYIKESGSADYTPQEPEKLGGSRVFVGYLPEGAAADADPTELTAGGAVVRIRFDRSSGSFATAEYADCAALDIQGGSKHYRLTMTRLTGKTTLELVSSP